MTTTMAVHRGWIWISGTNKIQFVSKATLETITGTSTAVSGSVTTDPNAIAGSKAEIRVEVASLG